MTRLVLSVFCLSLAGGAIPRLESQSHGFLIMLGRDTVALERVERTGWAFSGELVTIPPRVRRVQYRAELDAQGRVASFELSSVPGVETPPAPSQRVMMEFGDTLAVVVRSQTGLQGTRVDTIQVRADRGTVPWLGNSAALLEQMTLQAARSGKDSVAIALLAPGQRQITPNYVARRGADSVAIDYFGAPFYAKVDRSGRMEGLDGSRTTNKLRITRRPGLDLAAAAEPFLARERGGRTAGQLSPRDTARATIAGAPVLVDYSRPSKRGREVFGGIVPWGQVWRTGANTATHLDTKVDLRVGGQVIPAGRYTLWTLPTQTGVTLIVNKQVGQWGTTYDSAQDLLRLDLKVEPLPGTVEQFTIAVVDLGGAGELRFDWDRTRWILPFTIGR